MSIRSFFTASSILLFPLATHSRHAHHQNHIHARQLVVPVIASSETVASTTASPTDLPGDAAIEDIQNIQSGLTNLPEDMLHFVEGVEAHLQTIEDLLKALVSGPATAGPTESPSAYLITSLPDTVAHTSTTSTTNLSSSTTTSRGPFVPTRTTTRKITQTATHTVTPLPLYPTATEPPYPYHGTNFNASAINAPTAYGTPQLPPATGSGRSITHEVSFGLNQPVLTTLKKQARTDKTEPTARGL